MRMQTEQASSKSPSYATFSGWEALRQIKDDYKSRQVPGSKNSVCDDIWIVQDGQDNPIKFDFINYKLPDGRCIGDNEFIGLRLFLQVRTFHILEQESKQGQPFATLSVYNAFLKGRSTLLNFLIQQNILLGSSESKPLRSLSNFTPFLMELLLEDIEGLSCKPRSKSSLVIGISKYLAEDMRVPSFFRTPFNLFGKTSPGNIIYTGTDIDGWKPIPQDDYFCIGNSSLEFLHSYAEGIISIHELTVEVWQLNPPDDVKAAFAAAVARGYEPKDAKFQYITHWRLNELRRRMKLKGVKLPTFTDEHRRFWNVENVSLPSSDSEPLDLDSSGFTLTYIYYLFLLLFGAICIVCLIPTGMRNSELRRIDISRVSKAPNYDGIFSYINRIKKIKPASALYAENEIPIPFETWHAFHLLDRLSAPLRRTGSSLICVKPLHLKFASSGAEVDVYGTILEFSERLPDPKATNGAIAAFCRFVRSGTIPTSHRFRKSIAEFMLFKTKKAPLLLCQLFGHKSITMTLKYLKKSSLIKREVNAYAIERFKPAAEVVARALSTNRCAGPMAVRIGQAINERDNFSGLTQAELQLALEEWLMDKICNQYLLLIHTPTNVCCRSSAAKDRPPCSGLDPNYSELAAAATDPSHCTGAKCNWSLFTYEDATTLNDSLLFYRHMLKSLNPALLKNQLFLAHACDFVETYDPILDRIIQVPLKEAKSIIEGDAG